MPSDCENELSSHLCPVCGEHMDVNDEWALRDGLETGVEASKGDYVHKDCWVDEATTGGAPDEY